MANLSSDERLEILESIWTEQVIGKSGYPEVSWGLDFELIDRIVADHEQEAAINALKKVRAKVYNGAPEEDGYPFQSFYNEGVAAWLDLEILRLEHGV